MSDIERIEPSHGKIPERTIFTDTRSAAPISTKSTMSPMDKEKLEDLIAMLPKAWLDYLVSLNVWQNIDTNLGLAGLIERLKMAPGMIEGTIVLACLAKWGQFIQQEAQANREKAAKDALDPIANAVRDYAKSTGTGVVSLESLEIMQILRNSPLLIAALKSVDSDSFASAYRKAEHEIIMQILKSWEESQEMRKELLSAESQAKAKSEAELLQQRRAYELLKNYLADIRNKEQVLSQPILSIILSGLTAEKDSILPLKIDLKTKRVELDSSKDSILPIGQPVLVNVVKDLGKTFALDLKMATQPILIDLSMLLGTIQMTAAYWAIPGAITFFTAKNVEESKAPSFAAIRSYAMTIAQFVTSSEFDAFIKNIILNRIPKELHAKVHTETFIAAFKITLLSNALAALDKVTTDSEIFRGGDLEGLINGEISLPENDFRVVLIKLLREQFAILEKIAPHEVPRLLQLLMNYYNTKNLKLETLIDPTKAFLALFDMRFFRKVSAAESV